MAINLARGFNVLQRRAQPGHLQQLQRQLSTKTETKVAKNGPTAVVFMNMGGPGNQGEVRDFLHRLFVRLSLLKLIPIKLTF
jgi:ferrochelatase